MLITKQYISVIVTAMFNVLILFLLLLLGELPVSHVSRPMVSPIEEISTPASDDPPIIQGSSSKAAAALSCKAELQWPSPLPQDTVTPNVTLEKHRQLSGPHECNCWCQDWAEIVIRRPTGVVQYS